MLLNVMWYIQYLGRKIFDGIRGERSIDVIMLSYNSSGRSLLFDTMYQVQGSFPFPSNPVN